MQKAFRRRSAELDGQSPVTRLTLKLQLRSLAVISRIVAPLNVPIANRCVKQDSASVGGIFEVFKMQSRADEIPPKQDEHRMVNFHFLSPGKS
jgi:hypothetical protein